MHMCVLWVSILLWAWEERYNLTESFIFFDYKKKVYIKKEELERKKMVNVRGIRLYRMILHED